MSRDCLGFCFFQDRMFTFPAFTQFSRLSRFLSGRILLFSAPCSPHNYLKCFVFSHMGPTSDLLHTGFNLPALMELLLIQFTLARNHTSSLCRAVVGFKSLIVLHMLLSFLRTLLAPKFPPLSESPTIIQSSCQGLKGDNERKHQDHGKRMQHGLLSSTPFSCWLWLSRAVGVRRHRTFAANPFLLVLTLS